jgi:hypothetical protein
MFIDNESLVNVKNVFNGFHVEAKRHPTLGHWCGYITVPLSHPWKKPQEEGYDLDINCHGGVTYYHHGNNDVVIGFDCSHSYDAAPPWLKDKSFLPFGGQYRDIYYVLNELKNLADQASGA